jgi:hypothetical protein
LAKVLSLFHASCGVRLSRVRLGANGAWSDALLSVARHMESAGLRCPRCKMRVKFLDLLPSVDDVEFQPVLKRDEAGLVGFGIGQGPEPGHKI